MTLKKKKSKNIIRHRMRARCFLIMVRVKGSKRRSSKGRLCHCFITAGSRARGRPTTTLTTPARAIKPCLAALYLYDYSLLDRPTSQPSSQSASQPRRRRRPKKPRMECLALSQEQLSINSIELDSKRRQTASIRS